MLIRPMSEGDVAAVVDLTLANYDGVLAKHHTAGILAGFRADITPQFFREQLAWKQVFAVEEAGEVVATGALADFGTPDEPRYTVSQFYVCSDLHGRGIGRRLLEHLVATTRELGVDSLHVPSSRNAIPFYRHAGFSVDVLQPDAATEITWMTMPLYGRPEVQAVPPVSDGRAAQVDDERTAHGVPLETTVRAFRAADLEPVEALIHTTIDASYTGAYPPRAVRFFKDYHTPDRILERQATGEVVVAERDGDLVATGAIVGDRIVAVFVHPQLQRRGIGARVMDALEGAARAAGQLSIQLDVSLPSEGFYRRRGYRLLESRWIDVGDGERLDYWTAEKSLGVGES